MKYLILSILTSSIFMITFCSPDIDHKKSQKTLDSLLKAGKDKSSPAITDQSKETLLNETYDIRGAEKVFSGLAKKYPNNPEYLYYAGRSTFFIGEYNLFPNIRDHYNIAYDYFKKALKIKPQNAKYLLMKAYALGRIGLFIRKKEGGFLSGVTELRASQKVINQIIARDDLDSQPLEELDKIMNKGNTYVEALLTRGEVYMEAPEMLGGNKEMAIKIYKRVAEKRPNNMRAHLLLGKHYKNIGQFDLARKEYNIAIKAYESGKAPKLPEIDRLRASLARNLGFVYWSQAKIEQAFQQFKENVKRFPASSSGHEWMGHYYNHIGQKQKAIEKRKAAAAKLKKVEIDVLKELNGPVIIHHGGALIVDFLPYFEY